MTNSWTIWSAIAWFIFEFSVHQEAKIKEYFRSIIELISLAWNRFLFGLFLSFIWILCVLHSDGICTKKAVLSTQENLPEILVNTTEEMLDAIVSYVRLSSREQAENTHALEQQRARVIAAGAQYVFEDIQKGRDKKRPNFDRLIECVKRGKIRKIIITRIDRISRSLVKLKELVDILNQYGTSLEILDQNLDLDTAQGKMLLNVLGMLAEWEVDLLSERVKHGKQHQRNQQWANGSCPWGYKVVDHRYVLDHTPYLCLLSDRPDNYVELSLMEDLTVLPGRTIAELARHAIDLFFQRKGARRALQVLFEEYGIVATHAKTNGADKIFHWTIRGLTQWLLNPVLDGHTAYMRYKTTEGKCVFLPQEQWQIVRNTHPHQRLFRDGEAATVKTTIQTNIRYGCGGFQKSLTGSDNHRPFAYQIGLVYCQECSSRCMAKSVGPKYLYYACRHAGLGCTNHKAVKRRHIEEALIEALVDQSHRLNQGEVRADKPLPVRSDALAQLETKLAWLEQSPGFDPDVEALKQKIQQQIEEEKNPFLSEDKVFDSSVEDLIRAGNNLAIWHLLNNDEKVEIYSKLVNKIYIQDGKVVSVVFNR